MGPYKQIADECNKVVSKSFRGYTALSRPRSAADPYVWRCKSLSSGLHVCATYTFVTMVTKVTNVPTMVTTVTNILLVVLVTRMHPKCMVLLFTYPVFYSNNNNSRSTACNVLCDVISDSG